jgi:hypothetical protein
MAMTFKWNFLAASVLLASWMLLSYGVPVAPVVLGVAGAAAWTWCRRDK